MRLSGDWVILSANTQNGQSSSWQCYSFAMIAAERVKKTAQIN